jgi:hypothetical protein
MGVFAENLADGTIACWGDSSDGQSNPPGGTFLWLRLAPVAQGRVLGRYGGAPAGVNSFAEGLAANQVSAIGTVVGCSEGESVVKT